MCQPTGSAPRRARRPGGFAWARRLVPLLTAASAFSVTAAKPVDLEAPVYMNAGRYPHFLETADFNGDALPDLLVSDWLGCRLRVLLGGGDGGVPDGTFTEIVSIPTHHYPYLCTTADLNGDGILDVVTGLRLQDGVDVAVGGGAGGVWDSTFSAASFFYSGYGAYGAAAGDFDEDGIVDLAVANDCLGTNSGDSVSVLFGTGANGVWDGGYADPVGYDVGHTPQMILAHDFNEDGILDLVVCNAHGYSVSVMIGRGTGGVGDGTFEPRVDYTVGSGTHALVVEDFNEDGIADLASCGWNSDNVSVLIGNGSAGVGDGTFGDLRNYLVGDAPRRLVSADFDGDGILDLATCEYYGRSLSILTGNGTGGVGNGRFSQARSYPAGGAAWSLVAGDFDGDDRPDLLVASPHTGGVGLHRGNGDGTVRVSLRAEVGDSSRTLVPGDWNEDGALDLAVPCRTDSTGWIVRILLGEEGEGFTAASVCSIGAGPIDAASADFDEDGILDLVTANRTDATLSILRGGGTGGTGDGTFENFSACSLTDAPSAVEIADLDGDGILDMLVSERAGDRVEVLLGNGTSGVGDGTFGPPSPFAVGLDPAGAAIGDFDDDGTADGAVALWGENEVAILLGDGSGGFAAPVTYATGRRPRDVVVGDWNDDGISDLAVAAALDSGATLFFGNGEDGSGDGTFTPAGFAKTGGCPVRLLSADMNGDGILDLVAVDSLSGAAAILLGNGYEGSGDGTFSDPLRYAAEDWVCGAALGNFDGAGAPDIALVGPGYYLNVPGGGVTLMMNRSWTTGVASPGPAPPPTGMRITSMPNPFNPAATILFHLDGPAGVRLAVFDAGGRRVRTLADRPFGAGEQRVVWNGTSDGGRAAPSGVYFALLRAGGETRTARMVLVR
ncbi:MAG: FG-GAP-like repeat-containing protein [Candidatus Eisenbacteria bacterium]